MKKRMSILLLTSLITLTGCKNVDNEKVPLYYKDESLKVIREFSGESALNDLKEELIDTKKNFILASYADPSCACWDTFKFSVLNNFVNNTKIPVYAIDTNLLESGYLGLPINKNKTNTPVIGIFEEGVVKFSLAYNDDSGPFKDLVKFESWLDRYVIRPLMTYVDLAALQLLLKGDKDFLINWSFEICPDCKIFDGEFMKEYLAKKAVSEKLPYYIIETAPIRADENIVWQDFKNEYGLSNVKNTVSGYGGGFVPTLQIIRPDGTDHVSNKDISPIIDDMLVFQNETVGQDDDGSFFISDSYFDGIRATKYAGSYTSEIGMSLEADKVNESSSGGFRLKSGARSDIHKVYAEKFLDYYWE